MKAKKFDCPDCGSEGGKINPIKGVVFYRQLRIGIQICPNCSGVWHRNRFELGIEIPSNDRGGTNWDKAADNIMKRRAFP